MSFGLRLGFLLLVLASIATLTALVESLRTPAPTPVPAEPRTVAERRERATVRAVLDGETIELTSGERVRYLGIRIPAADGSGQPHFLTTAATEANRALVAGRAVFLEGAQSERDADGVALRYVFREDSTFVQAELVRGGYARVDHDARGRYQPWLVELEADARRAHLGLWQASQVESTPTSLVLSTITLPTLAPGRAEVTAVPFVCGPGVVDVRGALDVAAAETRRNVPIATVVFQVVSVSDDGSDLSLNSAFPSDGHFRVLIPAALREQFSATPVSRFAGRCVAATGRLRSYRTTTQIILSDPIDIVVVR
ncbi:MAG: thermonuclease family protein [Ardenticatenaceae bacterium]|nr:thermonuclease family protein [Ardenticatenaceae bacterium]